MSLQSIISDFEQHKGELVINDFKVEQLIGVGTDDSDYYWIFNDGRKVTWATCVGGWIALRGAIPDSDYERQLLNIANLNFFNSPNLWNASNKPISQEVIAACEHYK